jgi:hypothetical protein
MPHLVLEGVVDLAAVVENHIPEIRRWGVAVLKTDHAWVRADGAAVLVEGVVVEHSRPLHPVALITPHQDEITVRLWQLAPVERTPAVQRWLALVAADLCNAGAGPLRSTNLPSELLTDLKLSG